MRVPRTSVVFFATGFGLLGLWAFSPVIAGGMFGNGEVSVTGILGRWPYLAAGLTNVFLGGVSVVVASRAHGDAGRTTDPDWS
jgi:hypothetical protein